MSDSTQDVSVVVEESPEKVDRRGGRRRGAGRPRKKPPLGPVVDFDGGVVGSTPKPVVDPPYIAPEPPSVAQDEPESDDPAVESPRVSSAVGGDVLAILAKDAKILSQSSAFRVGVRLAIG